MRSFTFKFKQADKAAAAIKPLLSKEGSMSIQPSTNSLVVTDRAENMKAVAKMIGDFDKEPQSFRLYVRIVGASRVEGTPKIADDLKDVARKLAILPYNSYESVGEATVQGKEGDPGLIDMSTGYRAELQIRRIRSGQRLDRRQRSPDRQAHRRAARSAHAAAENVAEPHHRSDLHSWRVEGLRKASAR